MATYNLTYDAENRLTTVKIGATTIASFVYDGDGNRLKATVSGATTTFIGTHFEWTGSTSTMVKYYYAGASRIAMRVGNGTTNTNLTWLTGDHLGSTSVTADYDSTLNTRTLYKPWGGRKRATRCYRCRVRYQSGTLPTDYTFTGQFSESYVNLLFYSSWRYDPALDHFIQLDAIVQK